MKSQAHPQLLQALETRFGQHMRRHEGVTWAEVRARLEGNHRALHSLAAMEATGGEPDVVGRDAGTGHVVFCDCAPESPAGRRSLCYDDQALQARKEHKPQGSAEGMAADLGIALLTEEGYGALQALGEFDLKTSTWIATPPGMRAQGGALFGDRRYGRVFTYHNGAQSYYASRGFRGTLVV